MAQRAGRGPGRTHITRYRQHPPEHQ